MLTIGFILDNIILYIYNVYIYIYTISWGTIWYHVLFTNKHHPGSFLANQPQHPKYSFYSVVWNHAWGLHMLHPNE